MFCLIFLLFSAKSSLSVSLSLWQHKSVFCRFFLLFLAFGRPIGNIVQASSDSSEVKQRTSCFLHLFIVALGRFFRTPFFQRERIARQSQLGFQEVMSFLKLGGVARSGVYINGPIPGLLLDLALVVLFCVAAFVAMDTRVAALVWLGCAVGVVLLGVTADQWGVAGWFTVTSLPTTHQNCPV